LIAQSQCVKAIEIADQIPDVQIGQNANILGLLGICYANMKDYRQAVQYFDKALKIDPAQYEARLYQPRVKSLLKQ
jgi:tetratricopeptide (TPR) repeat protein